MEMIRTDQTTADSRLADYLLDLNPATTDGLTNLALGGYFARGRIWVLHSRFRYFDPVKRRAGLPEDVGALVEKLGADSAVLALVNLNPIEPRDIVVQAGGYGEHRFDGVTIDGTDDGIERPRACRASRTGRRRPPPFQDDPVRTPTDVRLPVGSRVVPRQ